MFQYTPEHGTSNWGDTANAGAGIGDAAFGARAFVPPADRNSQPYTDDYPPTTPHSGAHDDGYYYSTTNGAGYPQNDADYYNNTNAAAAGGYYNYADGSQMGSEPYNDQNYYNEGYNDAAATGMAGIGATGMAAGAYGTHNAYDKELANTEDKTFMHAGENSDSRQVYSKPDAKE